MAEYTVKVEPSTTYRIRSSERCEWADITIREFPGGGALSIISDFGNWSYQWTAIGSGTFTDFLDQTDYGYFWGKMAANHGQVEDWDLTLSRMRTNMLSWRRDGVLTKGEAAEAWVVLNEPPEIESFDCLMSDLMATSAYEHFWECQPATVDDPQCRMFWDTLWQAMLKYWRDTE